MLSGSGAIDGVSVVSDGVICRYVVYEKVDEDGDGQGYGETLQRLLWGNPSRIPLRGSDWGNLGPLVIVVFLSKLLVRHEQMSHGGLKSKDRPDRGGVGGWLRSDLGETRRWRVLPRQRQRLAP